MPDVVLPKKGRGVKRWKKGGLRVVPDWKYVRAQLAEAELRLRAGGVAGDDVIGEEELGETPEDPTVPASDGESLLDRIKKAVKHSPDAARQAAGALARGAKAAVKLAGEKTEEGIKWGAIGLGAAALAETALSLLGMYLLYRLLKAFLEHRR